MARPSKLTLEQWREIEVRLNNGERAASLAREFGISQGSISDKITKVNPRIKETAQLLAHAHTKLNELNPAQQHSALNLADKLRGIGLNLATAADLGALTAVRLQKIANSEAQKINEVEPLESEQALKGVSLLSKLANESSSLAVQLMNYSKTAPPEAAEVKEPGIDVSKLDTEVLAQIVAAKQQ